MPSGDAHRKLSPIQKEEIRRRFAAGEAPSVLCSEYDISRGVLYGVAGTPLDAEYINREYMLAVDAAEYLEISKHTMLDYLESGVFPGAFLFGRKHRIWMVPRVAVERRKKTR